MLLSSILVFGFSGSALARYQFSTEMVHSVSIDASHSTVQQGDVVDFELIVTNVSDQTLTISYPVSTPDKLWVYPASVTDPLDPEADAIYVEPQGLFYLPGQYVLEPGECLFFDYAWDSTAHPCELGGYRSWRSDFPGPVPGGAGPPICGRHGAG